MSQDLLVRLPCDFSGNGLQNQRMLTLDHLVEWLPTSGQVGFLSSRTFYLDEIVHAQSLSHVRLFVTQWIAAHQAPLSMGFFTQEYWSGLPFPLPKTLQPLENQQDNQNGLRTGLTTPFFSRSGFIWGNVRF